jgi:hypothetical protein
MRILTRTLSLVPLALVATASTAYAKGGASNPAGGAAITDIVAATGGALVMTALLFWVGYMHRAGRAKPLERMAAWSEQRFGLPGWASLPGLLATLSLIVALLGMYWDISLHIDDGRDPGPLANPAHYLILFGLGGVFASGFLSMVLAREKPSETAVRITKNWYAPLGGVLLFACGAFSLSGFPLDDVWHRLFGQDVTLWGPTHLMLFGGAALTLVGRAVLLGEGARAHKKATGERPPWLAQLERGALIGGLLIGLSTIQGEFDFGVPQFQLIFQPALIMLAAGIALVAARIWAGRGGALLAAILFISIRGIVSLIVGPVFGEVTPHFPLYIAEAGIVELVALRLSTDRTLAFGAVSGLLIGTVGLAAEWGWSHVWMPIPWPSSLLAEAAIIGPAMALAGGLIGSLLGTALASDHVPMPRRAGWALGAAFLSVVAMAAYGLHTTTKPDLRAQVTTTEVGSGPNRSVNARIALSPRDAAKDAKWLLVSDWQGGKKLIVDRLKRVSEGVYETTRPFPAHGGWKALLRFHTGNSLQALALYMPEDRAIPAPAVPLRPQFTRSFGDEKHLLQREAKVDPGPVSKLAYLAVLLMALAILAALTVGLRRYARAGAAATGTPPDAPAVPGRVRGPSRATPALGS